MPELAEKITVEVFNTLSVENKATHLESMKAILNTEEYSKYVEELTSIKNNDKLSSSIVLLGVISNVFPLPEYIDPETGRDTSGIKINVTCKGNVYKMLDDFIGAANITGNSKSISSIEVNGREYFGWGDSLQTSTDYPNGFSVILNKSYISHRGIKLEKGRAISLVVEARIAGEEYNSSEKTGVYEFTQINMNYNESSFSAARLPKSAATALKTLQDVEEMLSSMGGSEKRLSSIWAKQEELVSKFAGKLIKGKDLEVIR